MREIKLEKRVDLVPVVRCKDCKWWENWNIHNGSCERLNKLDIIEGGWFGADADDFCSFAERRDDETDRR